MEVICDADHPCNGEYRRHIIHSGKLSYTNAKQCRMFFEDKWKICAGSGEDAWLFSHQGTDSAPPTGVWTSSIDGLTNCIVEKANDIRQLDRSCTPVVPISPSPHAGEDDEAALSPVTPVLSLTDASDGDEEASMTVVPGQTCATPVHTNDVTLHLAVAEELTVENIEEDAIQGTMLA